MLMGNVLLLMGNVNIVLYLTVIWQYVTEHVSIPNF